MDIATAHRRRALLHKTERWLSLLTNDCILCTLIYPDGADAFVTVELTVDIVTAFALERGNAPSDHASAHGRLRRVREAIDLFYMALTLDADSVLSRGISGASLEQVTPLARAGAFELHVTLTTIGLGDAVLLERRLAQYFMEDLDRVGSTHATFVRVRTELEQELQLANPTWKRRLAQVPVVLRCSLATPGDTGQVAADDESIEDHWNHVINFIVRAAAWRSDSGIDDDVGRVRHLPLEWDQVRVWVTHLLVTDRVVATARRLETIRKGFVVCERVYVDPWTVRASCDNVTTLLNALSAGHEAKRLAVYVGEQGVDVSDMEEVEYTEMYDAVCESVAKCDNLKRVDLSGMMDDQTATITRRAFYRAMIQRFLSRRVPLNISFESVTTSLADTEALEAAHGTWRDENPAAKLCVKKLLLQVSEGDNSFSSRFLRMLDDAEKLSILNDDESAELLPATIIPTIVTTFASLRKLDMAQVAVPSMDLFLEPLRLEELRLCDFHLADHESFTRFVRALGDPTTRLARTLQVLEVQDVERYDVFRITPHEIDQICEALQTNQTLRTVELCLRAPDAQTQAMCDRLKETTGRVVGAKQSGRSFLVERERRLAFLSVVHGHQVVSTCRELDSSIVRQILGFAAPATERVISVHVAEMFDASDDEDNGTDDE